MTVARLHGAVALVTGGGSGTGAAACRALAARGTRVVGADLDGHAAAQVADEVGGPGALCDDRDPAA